MIDQFARWPFRIDILNIPLIGRWLRWQHSRTIWQLTLLTLALIMIADGLFGSPLAAKNTATVAAWVHYRGFIVLALLFFGNLFCAGCPFILTRGLARRLGRPTQRFPKALRNKWTAIGALIGIMFLYEWLDLWASSWLTAWVIIAYFLAAFVFEAFFTHDAFCLYVCPLGTFNFLYSGVSPTQITENNLQTCRDCVGHECVNGQTAADGALIQQGCQTELFVPTMQSNMNCTLCLDCVKACPHDNVALAVRPPGDELFQRTWPQRLDTALLAIIAAFLGLVNAFAMTPPVYALQARMAAALNTRSELLVLGVIFLFGVILLPLGLSYGAAWIGRALSGERIGLSKLISRYAYSFVALGFGIWAAHYLFHLLVGPLTIIPVLQGFFADVIGAPLFGQPDWALAARWVLPLPVIRGVQIAAMLVGLVTAVAIAWRAARAHASTRSRAARAVAPWLILLLLLAVAAIYVFMLPMEMRGNVLG